MPSITDLPLKYFNIFAIHYFLWFAALTSIYGFINVYAQHYANTDATKYGYLGSVLPFITILTKIYFCSLADRYRAYRSFFVVFIILALLGYGSFAVLPYFVTVDSNDKQLKVGVWAIICIMTSVGTISMSVISCLTDAFAMNSSVKNKRSYGLIRVWGTIGWGIASLILAQINQSTQMPYLVPGIVLLIILISLDIFIVILWPDREEFNLNRSARSRDDETQPAIGCSDMTGVQEDSGVKYGSTSDRISPTVATNLVKHEQDQISSVQTQWNLFKKVVAKRPSILRYMTLFTLSGALIGLQWSYYFQYLTVLYKDDFSYVSGISMFAQSMLGELPFFILSSHIVKFCGRSKSLSISIATIGLRYLLYEFVMRNMSYYSVLFIEPLAGPNFGLFYVVMTDVGLDYSDCDESIDELIEERNWNANDASLKERLRNSLRATMQSVMGGCYEGLGVGVGALLGGTIIDQYDFSHLWVGSAAIAMSLSVVNLGLDFVKKPCVAD